jgi:toxin FitB
VSFVVLDTAACCLVRNLPLATLNLKDFRDFADHDGLRVIGIDER